METQTEIKGIGFYFGVGALFSIAVNSYFAFRNEKGNFDLPISVIKERVFHVYSRTLLSISYRSLDGKSPL